MRGALAVAYLLAMPAAASQSPSDPVSNDVFELVRRGDLEWARSYVASLPPEWLPSAADGRRRVGEEE
ncbi:hypothetical protein [Roseiterribacter gracilis]|uniref:Uncharacterized protein n=1 Tax=Roseiterribacter gracilis TaxID=2812848 RepID=A0A8S8X6R8_9PROT|nr:hypothetical protein TMPK1_12650 [Rhodospirillales bacterium TMPK1]